MNPWINHPRMVPIESGFQDPLPGQVGFVISEKGAPLGRE
jgi:hypothetical protein